MANTNWFKGIQESGSTAGGTQVALAGWKFTDIVNGSDSNDGSIENPWKTFRYSYNQLLAGQKLCVASGYYEDSQTWTAISANVEVHANIDKTVLIKNTVTAGAFNASNNNWDVYGIVFVSTGWNCINQTLSDCVLYDSALNRAGSSGENEFNRCSIIKIGSPTSFFGTPLEGGDFRCIGSTGIIAKMTFNNCTFSGTSKIKCAIPSNPTAGDVDLNNCDAQSVTFDINNLFITDGREINIDYCNTAATIATNVDTSGSVDLDTLGTQTNNINLDPSYIGDPNKIELLISSNSPLIGAGENGTTIGAFRVGELVDLSSPAENNDITVGATIEITDPATTGNIKPALKTFSQIRVSPIVKINGLPDNFDDIPNNETTLIPPKRRTINITYRTTVGGADLTGEFLYGVPMLQDDAGNKTGEDDFDIFNISSTGSFDNLDSLTSANLLTVAQIQPNFVFNDVVPFISSWKTDNTGASANDEISLPLLSGGTYNMFVDWGDGNGDWITTYNQAETTHTYSSASTYEVKIYGTCKGWSFDLTANNKDPQKITDISKWSSFQPTDDGTFKGCTNLDVTATDIIDLSQTTDLTSFFEDCSSLVYNSSIDSWDITGVTITSLCFAGATAFNQPIDSWDMSAVVNPQSMFEGATSFNQSLNSWNVTSFTNVSNMFQNATAFNGNVTSWTTTLLSNCTRMFSGCTNFNQDISGWDVGNVTGMRQMFLNCASFDQPIGLWGTDVSGVGNFSDMFKGCSVFNSSLIAWTPTGATSMQAMFDGATLFNKAMAWSVPNCTDFVRMFKNCINLNQDYSAWTIGSVSTTVRQMFNGCTALDQDLSGWNWTNISDAEDFLLGCTFSTVNYDALLVDIESQAVQNNITFSGGNSTYSAAVSAAATARAALIADHTWAITDGGGV